MTDNVVHVGDFGIARKSNLFVYSVACQHKHVELDDHGLSNKC